ncbi:MAG: GerMN domain-containing protein [Defluviitaleaceae bacterium]|nr:GerMN domain-containing protein [Defluviitaleaceae bacterium]
MEFFTKKNIIVISAALCFILFTVVLGFFLSRTFEYERAGRMSVYFFNVLQGRLEPEQRDFPQGSIYEQMEALFAYMAAGPDDTDLAGLWPGTNVSLNEFLTDVYVNEDAFLVASFSDLYEEMSPVEGALFRSAFTLTMSGLPFVDGVIFRSESGERLQTVESIANSPIISPTQRMAEDFTFYFVDESGEGLISINYHMADVDQHMRTTPMLERMIELQNEPGIMPLIPPETQIRTVLIEPRNPGIYVDFSLDFHRNFNGTPAQALLMLKSITHTVLANNPAYNRVFFLIESERRDDFHGVNDFDIGFTMDESFMLGFVPPVEYE